MPVAPMFPTDLVQQFRQARPAEALSRWKDTRILLIDVGDEQSELLSTLTSSSTVGGSHLLPVRDGIQFMTKQTQLPTAAQIAAAGKVAPPMTMANIASTVARSPHFVAPIRKRDQSGRAVADRVSVGRARNSDIVLRHNSVSKFHAWFHCDEDNALWVTDAGSTNHVFVGGYQLLPGSARSVEDGMEIIFGTVACVLCSPGMVWEVIARHSK